jgi:hypothetical protein
VYHYDTTFLAPLERVQFVEVVVVAAGLPSLLAIFGVIGFLMVNVAISVL